MARPTLWQARSATSIEGTTSNLPTDTKTSSNRNVRSESPMTQRERRRVVRKRLTTMIAAGVLVVAGAMPALAGPPAGAGDGEQPAGIACQQAGISTLKSLGLLSAVAKGGIEVAGVGIVPFPTVLDLHRTSPELFQTGGVSVVVPGVGTVAATWCDGI